MDEWQESPIGYMEPYSVVCDLCGQLVPGRYWAADVNGSDHIFCNPRHAELYETYWLPLHGQNAA